MDNLSKTKQVIVIRRDLSMRKGKMVAQGAHSSIAFLTSKLRNSEYPNEDLSYQITLAPAEVLWLGRDFVKICVGVDSLEELLAIHNAALEAGVTSHLITDAGYTEFKEPTITCCALGPDFNEKLDDITGHLRLL